MAKWKPVILLALVAVVVLLVKEARAQDDNRPRLRVVHASPVLPNVDVYINDILFFDNLVYRYISDYVPIDPGDRTLKVRAAGASFREGSIVEVTAPYSENQNYTIIAAGSQGEVQYWRIEDDSDLPGDGSAKVRIVHASFQTPSTDVCLAQVCYTLAFKEDTGYFLMAPGVYIPRLRFNNTDVTLVETPPLTLRNNSVHTIFLIGRDQKNPTLQLLYALDAGSLNKFPPGGAPPRPGRPGLPPPTAPPPLYPPETGVFLSPQVIMVMIGVVALAFGGLGLGWISRR